MQTSISYSKTNFIYKQNYSIPNSTILSTNSSRVFPVSFRALGKIDTSDNPGIVFTSRKNIHLSLTIQSILAIHLHHKYL